MLLSIFVYKKRGVNMESLEEFASERTEGFKRQIQAWKEEYYGAVYVTQIGDHEYIWRGLSKAEFRKANEWFVDDYERAEYLCRTCVLYPEIDDYSLDIYAGVPEVLTEQVLSKSGFTMSKNEFDTKIWELEQQMLTFDNQMASVIKEVFQDIPMEEIEEWQFDKTLWYYSRAKWTMENLRGISLEREEVVPGIPGMPPPKR